MAIDTSGADLSVAIVENDRALFERTVRMERRHSVAIMPLIDDALNANGVRIGDIDAFAVVLGPGSFTGVRIGVSTVKAFAHALNKPICGVNALHALAYDIGGVVVPMINARNAQVYAARFENGSRVSPDGAGHFSEFLCDHARYIGDGAFVNGLGKNAHIAPINVARIALTRGFVDQNTVVPEYLRAPQAQREWEARHGEI